MMMLLLVLLPVLTLFFPPSDMEGGAMPGDRSVTAAAVTSPTAAVGRDLWGEDGEDT